MVCERHPFRYTAFTAGRLRPIHQHWYTTDNLVLGNRLSTYVIKGPRDSGVIGINGAAARLISPVDLVIIIAYAAVSDAEARTLEPSVVFVDEHNRVLDLGTDPAAAPAGSELRSGALMEVQA